MDKVIYIHRELEKEINKFIKRKEVLSILGPRQSGKTTFLKYIEKEIGKLNKKVKFLTFENRSDLALFQGRVDDFKNFIKSYDYVIIDEFQYAKDGGQKLKYLYDTSGIKFIVSGSSSLDLRFQTGKYMVGRILDFTLLPFSFREYLSSKDNDLYGLVNSRIDRKFILDFEMKHGFGAETNKRLSGALEEYAVYGGYPAVVLSETEEEKKKILEGIVDTYLLRDIRSLLNLATEEELMLLGKFLASQIGNLINYAELSRASGLTYKEVKKHLNILEKTFILNLVKPFFTNRRTELTKNPKAYFTDLGLRNLLLADFRATGTRNDVGAVMENYAYNLISRMDFVRDLKYWRTKSKAEVDFVIEKEGTMYPVEVKYMSRRNIGRSFFSFIDKFNPKTGIILTKDYIGEEKYKNTKIKFIPLSYF